MRYRPNGYFYKLERHPRVRSVDDRRNEGLGVVVNLIDGKTITATSFRQALNLVVIASEVKLKPKPYVSELSELISAQTQDNLLDREQSTTYNDHWKRRSRNR